MNSRACVHRRRAHGAEYLRAALPADGSTLHGGRRRFGMATVGTGHELFPTACECEILECQPQPDGCGSQGF